MGKKADANTRSRNMTMIIVAIISLLGVLISAGFLGDLFEDSSTESKPDHRSERPGAVRKR